MAKGQRTISATKEVWEQAQEKSSISMSSLLDLLLNIFLQPEVSLTAEGDLLIIKDDKVVLRLKGE